MKLFTKIHLIEALKNVGIVIAYKTIIEYERKGIIPTSKNGIEYEVRPGRTRFYTEEELKNIVEKVKEYRSKDGQ